MRSYAENGGLSVRAISGTYVVILGINLEEQQAKGLLGFAIERTDHTENERYWLKGFRTFEDTDPNVPAGAGVSTREHPIQAFTWSDFTAKPGHEYTYRIVALRGRPKNLKESEDVEVFTRTEDDASGKHAIYFNRGVAGSQAYAHEFKNKPPADIPERKAWIWLSRGLEEALLGFIAQATDARYAIRAAIYEFQYEPVAEALKAAKGRGVDVKVVIDAKLNGSTDPKTGKPIDPSPRKKNIETISSTGIADLAIKREANPSYIAHNKFIVLLRDDEPIEVWTGSTNLTPGGIFGHSNVGHIVRDPAVAKAFLGYWAELSKDAEAQTLRKWNSEMSAIPDGDPPTGCTIIFSPQSSLKALEWYRDCMDRAKTGVFLTAAFTVHSYFEEVLSEPKGYLRYVLLEREVNNIELIRRDPDNRVAIGSALTDGILDRWLQETNTGRLDLNQHVNYIHTKYMLIDPLSDDPIVITGSANFSDASVRKNDENMLVIRGDTRVADIYVGEFMRLFNHFFFRRLIQAGGDQIIHLAPDDAWTAPYYREGASKQKERALFSTPTDAEREAARFNARFIPIAAIGPSEPAAPVVTAGSA